MDFVEFGKIVRALRQNNIDENGNTLSRERLSESIHLTPHQLGRLERGDRKYLESETLDLLANAFNLTAFERNEFYLAALGILDEMNHEQEKPDEKFDELVHILEKLIAPAFIIDAYADMVAANSSLFKLLMITPEMLDYAKTIPAGFNILNFIYSPLSGFKEMIGPKWREYAKVEILLFRRSSLRYRHTYYFDHILKTLLKEKDFSIDWYTSHIRQEQYDATYVHYEYLHPCYGSLSYLITETVVNSRSGNLYLVVYNPMDEPTAAVFHSLIKPEERSAKKLAGWPEKVIITG